MSSPLISFNNSETNISILKDNPRPRRQRHRVISKNGECNILLSNISKEGIRFIQDIFTTLVDIQWRWTMLIFLLTFLISWLIFSLIWWLIIYTHGDLEEDHLPMHQAENGWTPCVLNMYHWTSCFLYSVETQTTIGYGVRVITEECPEAVFMTCVQAIAGMGTTAFMVGIVFAKMIKPKVVTLLFSRQAVISQRDGSLYLMFRVGDMRKSQIIGATIHAQLVRPKKTPEGEILGNYCTQLDLQMDDCDNNLLFLWPLIITHKIDENSPFYKMSAADIIKDNFEILVVLEGTVHSTGQSMQAKSSYLPKEILWGHRFEPIVRFNTKKLTYDISYQKFDYTYPVGTTSYSAEELNRYQAIEGDNDYESIKPPHDYEDLTSSFV